MIKTLHKSKQAIKSLMTEHELKGLEIEELIAIIWSFRKEGCYMTNGQLAEQCYCTERSIKRYMALLRDKGLVQFERRYNSSTIYTPSEIMVNALQVKGRSGLSVSKEKGQKVQAGGDVLACYSSSIKIEEQDNIQSTVDAFLEASPGLKASYLNQVKAFGVDHANNSILALIKA